MSEEHDLHNLIRNVRDMKGSYIAVAHELQDPGARKLYRDLQTDMDRHLRALHDRLYYLHQKQSYQSGD